MSSTTTLYQDLPNDSDTIRLVTLCPDFDNAAIKCKLDTARLSEHPSYIALSYTWGDDLAAESLIVNELPITIRQNLWHFLKRIRSHSSAMRIWCDALCISQQNLLEKNRQVAIIGQIFKQAVSVSAWLGNNDDKISLGLRRFIDARSHSKVSKIGLSFRTDQEELSYVDIEATRELLQRPYWARTWVQQEIILSQDILLFCGDVSFRWETLGEICGAISSLQLRETYSYGTDSERQDYVPIAFVQNSRYAKLQAMKDNYGPSSSAPSLSMTDLLELSFGTICSDQRDRVYALLSLGQRNSSLPQADYSVDVKTLYFKVLGLLHTRSPVIGELLRRTLGLTWLQLSSQSAENSEVDPSHIVRMTLPRLRNPDLSKYRGSPVSSKAVFEMHQESLFPGSKLSEVSVKHCEISPEDEPIYLFPGTVAAVVAHFGGNWQERMRRASSWEEMMAIMGERDPTQPVRLIGAFFGGAYPGSEARLQSDTPCFQMLQPGLFADLEYKGERLADDYCQPNMRGMQQLLFANPTHSGFMGVGLLSDDLGWMKFESGLEVERLEVELNSRQWAAVCACLPNEHTTQSTPMAYRLIKSSSEN